RHVQPERASRKVVRLIHQVRAVVWEVCACQDSALLRENELLRLHKPKFNVMNARPEHYLFVGVRVCRDEIHIRLTRQPLRLPDETLHGAFKAVGRVRAGFTAMLRLLWAAEYRPTSMYHYPMPLVAGRCPADFRLRMVKSDAEHVAALLRKLLEGQDEELVCQFENTVPAIAEGSICQQSFRKMDMEALKLF